MADAARARTPGRALAELAGLYGILPSWIERGKRRRPSPGTVLDALRALGAPVHGPDDVHAAVRARTEELGRRLTEPVSVSWARRAPRVQVRLTERESRGRLECSLVLEDGERRDWRVLAGAIALGATDAEGGRVQASFALPGAVPQGYHQVTVKAGRREARTLLIRAPETTWDPADADAASAVDAPAASARDFGLFLPLYALRTGRSWGTADLTDLRALLAWGGERGARFVGTLPLMAAFLGGGQAPLEPSPYAPVSRLFWNELYLDVERVPGLEHAPEAQELLRSDALRRDVERLARSDRARYAEAMAVKRRVLEAVVRASVSGDRLSGPLAAHADARPETGEYARFRAAVERLGPPSAWPPEVGLDAYPGTLPAAGKDPDAFRYHLYVQWAMERQMGELAALGTTSGEGRLPALYLDLPLGAHREGFDVWRRPDTFALGLSGGAPPDAFFTRGQDWGFPPLHPERTREEGHAYTRLSLGHLMRAAGMIRLDHVMSFHRLYCIPAGHEARDGVYVRYPSEELFAVLCLESRRWRCEVVGEDLGTVADAVRKAMTRHRLRRMYVLPYELRPLPPDGPPNIGVEALLNVAPPLSIASLGTHDIPPFATFWAGEDVGQREREGLLTPEEAARDRDERARWRAALAAVLRREEAAESDAPGSGSRARGGAPRVRAVTAPGHPAADAESAPATAKADADDASLWRAMTGGLALLARSPARHVLVNVEDLWLERESQNTPGTSGPENWTRKARHALEAWDELPGTSAALERVRRTRAAGRIPDEEEKGKAWPK